jgi:hypothetical protein
MNQGIRSAEKDRISSCSLADKLAQACIAKYRGVCPTYGDSRQGVLAGIAATVNDSEIEVLCIATGNKFSQHVKSPTDSDKLRDCHAEVLVRRAFKHWLLSEWDRLKTQDNPTSRFFLLSRDFQLEVKPSVKLFLYITSAPCGNSCIRRWGQPQKEIFDSTLDLLELPSQTHKIFHAHAKKEGQTAVLYKGSSDILSCSDKILKWNVSGLQGRRLHSLVKKPILLDGIVVGRKFVSVHAQRAFCCRLTSKQVSREIRELVHHPVLMCSAVKFDDGTFQASDGEGAVFNSRSMWWTSGQSEDLDGSTGFQTNGSISKLSASSIHERCMQLGVRGPSIEARLLCDLIKAELIKL